MNTLIAILFVGVVVFLGYKVFSKKTTSTKPPVSGGGSYGGGGGSEPKGDDSTKIVPDNQF